MKAAGGRQVHLHLTMQQAQPANSFQGFVRGRQADPRFNPHIQQVDIGVVKTVKQGHARGPGFPQLADEVAEGRKVRTELDRDGQTDPGADLAQDLHVAGFDLGAGLREIRRHIVNIQLQRIAASRFHIPGVFQPAGHRYAVETADHWNGETAFEIEDFFQVFIEVVAISCRFGQETVGLAETDALEIQKAMHPLLIFPQRFLEQRRHDDGRRALILQASGAIGLARQGAGGDDQRIIQFQAQIAAAQIRHRRFSPAWCSSSPAPRARSSPDPPIADSGESVR